MNKLSHVAFIMDGNGRWGKKNNRGRKFGHLKGVETVKKIVSNSIKLKIPFVTFFVFSSENWRRPKSEILFLFSLINRYFSKEINNVISEGIKINILGDIKRLPEKIRKTLKKTIFLTRKNKKINVNLAINYGSKNEILNALKKTKNKINFKNIEKNLYTKNMPDPDILIRTGGRQRLSNFLLWQLAYAEIFFLNKLWPDFNKSDFKKIIEKYKKTKRNFGAL